MNYILFVLSKRLLFLLRFVVQCLLELNETDSEGMYVAEF